jgi:hypothetical protein
MIAALAEPDTLVVFGAIVVATSNTCSAAEMGYSTGGGVSWVTPFGLEKRTGLTREVIEAAAARLEQAGLVKAQTSPGADYTNWRPNETALTAAAHPETPPNR